MNANFNYTNSLVELNIFNSIKQFDIKVKTDNIEVNEMLKFIEHNSVLIRGKVLELNDLLFAQQLDQLTIKLHKKLHNRTSIRSIRFSYFELATVKEFYKKHATINMRVDYPQMVQLAMRMDQAIPTIINSNKTY